MEVGWTETLEGAARVRFCDRKGERLFWTAKGQVALPCTAKLGAAEAMVESLTGANEGATLNCGEHVTPRSRKHGHLVSQGLTISVVSTANSITIDRRPLASPTGRLLCPAPSVTRPAIRNFWLNICGDQTWKGGRVKRERERERERIINITPDYTSKFYL